VELAGEGVEGFFEGGGVDGEVGWEGEDLEVFHAFILGELVSIRLAALECRPSNLPET
jgi:hypothetical protein